MKDKLTEKSTMLDMVKTVGPMRRDLVSDGYDEALSQLARAVPMTVHEYPTGTACYTWRVPEKWTCREARLETLAGEVVFCQDDNPLHAMSYSLPFEGEVSRDELFAHLHVHPVLPDAIPYTFKYYDRDWGLCCSRRVKEALADDRYRVRIRSEFTSGALRVGEVVVPGDGGKTIVLCAHLCHPAQVNDDVSGVVVGIEVMRELMKRSGLRHTYRLLILPETIGSAAWISHNEDVVEETVGGLFLEMLARDHPHALQLSLGGQSRMDRACLRVLGERDPRFWNAPFRQVILNDERMFNSPGVRVPMLSLSRVLPRSHPDFPYREYHTDQDDVAHADIDAMRESVSVVLGIVAYLESERIPRPLFKGEIFVSGFAGLDYRKMFHLIHSVPYFLDGERDVARVAELAGLPVDEVAGFLDLLEKEGLVAFD